jgi:transcriptional antiterminator NusG
VTAPKGASYGDKMNIIVTVQSIQDPNISDSVTISSSVKQTIIAVKTIIGQEVGVVRDIAYRVSNDEKKDIFSIISPVSLRGYIFIETMHPDRLGDILKTVKYAKGMVDGEINLDEISHYLVPQAAVVGINIGDLVEVVDGPFKGEKAKIIEIYEDKEEVKLELFEAMVPIPITVKGDAVRLLEKEENI